MIFTLKHRLDDDYGLRRADGRGALLREQECGDDEARWRVSA